MSQVDLGSERASAGHLSGRPNWIEIDADAIRGNLAATRQLLAPNTKVFGTLKANAYGFGVVGVAKILAQAGIDAISVSDLGDAIRLREAGIACPIVLYAGYLPSDAVVDAVTRYSIIPTIYDDVSAAAFASRREKPTSFFVKIDVGLERIGIPAEKVGNFVAGVLRAPHLSLAGINTHFNVPAGEATVEAYIRWQAERFRAALASMKAAGIAVPVAVAESTGVFQVSSDLALGAADPGQLLFGLSPDGKPHKVRGVRPALKAIKSRVIQVRGIGRSDHFEIAPFPIRPGMRVGVIPIGMRDRMTHLSAGHVLVNGRHVPILGTPALEYTRIDLTTCPEAKVGDEVVLAGAQGEENISPEEIVTFRKQRRVADLAVAMPHDMRRDYLSSDSPRQPR